MSAPMSSHSTTKTKPKTSGTKRKDAPASPPTPSRRGSLSAGTRGRSATVPAPAASKRTKLTKAEEVALAKATPAKKAGKAVKRPRDASLSVPKGKIVKPTGKRKEKERARSTSTKRDKLTKAFVMRTVKAETSHLGKVDNTFQGLWADSGIGVPPVDKSADRAPQLLNQLSQLLINKVTKTQEIEAMSVNGRILVSANESATVTEVLGLKLRTLVTEEASSLAKQTGEKISEDFSTRKPAKLALFTIGAIEEAGPAGLTTDKRVTKLAKERATAVKASLKTHPTQKAELDGITATLTSVVGGDKDIVDGGSAADAAELLVARGHHSEIIAVGASEQGGKVAAHAEQNLILALVNSKHTGKAVIAGGKRPCMVCWITMALARKHGFDVQFDEAPGGYWDGTTVPGLHAVAVALGLTKAELLKDLQSLKVSEVEQHVTDDSTRDEGDPFKIDDLVDAIRKQKFTTRSGDQSDSDVD